MHIKLTLLVLILTSLACTANITALQPPAAPSAANIPTVIVKTILPATTDPSLDFQPVVKPQAISSIHMLDEQNGWMITDQTALRTVNGGITWHNVTPPNVTMLGFGTGASFLDSNRGWILISDTADPVNKGMLYHTSDGGLNWSSNTVPFGGGDLHFLDDTNGWMMLQGELLRGEPAPQWRPFFQGVRLYQTTDGGVNWTQVYTNMPADSGLGDSLPYSGLKTGLTPINMQEAWVSGRSLTVGDFFLYHTIDGGRTWSPSDYKLFFTEERFHVHPPEFFDSKNGILPFEAGSEGASLYFSRTADGGKTWTTGAAVSGTSFFSVVSPNDIFAWPDQFLVSHDSGQTWTRVVPNVDLLIGMIQFQFVDTQTGWVVTKDANNKTLLYKSVDGGHTWIAQN